MKFLLDENISETVSRGLRDAGYSVVHILDVGYEGRSDEDIMEFAQREKRIIVTHDKDFGNLVRFPVRTHAGVILIRLRNQSPRNTLIYLSRLLRMGENLSGKLVIIREGEYRIIGK